MGNKTATKRISARRAATLLAALGALVMSSGIALMVSATPASAVPDPKVVVCKYVSTPGGVLDHIVVVSENTLNNVEGYTPPADGDFWTDAQGGGGGSIAIRYAEEGEQAADIDTDECPQSEEEPDLATGAAAPNAPTCAANVPSYTVTGTNIEESGVTVLDASAAGTTVSVTLHAVEGAEFEGGGTTKDVDVSLGALATGCETVTPPVVEPPVVEPPVVEPPEETTTTPTVVHAGLAGASMEDVRGEQGLALMFAGMVMLVAAGGLRLRGSASRI